LLYLVFSEVCLEPFFANGHIESVFSTTNTLGDSRSVICDTGFKAESLNIICNQSRFWEPQPVCTVVTCPIPVNDNGSFTTSSTLINQDGHVTPDIENSTYPDHPDNLNTTKDYKYNSTVFLTCNDGYEANGPTSFTCLSDGTWGNRTSTCVKILCNDTDEVNHEAVIRIPDLGISETGNALYNTEYFFLSDGDIKVECQVNRKLKWKKKPTFGKDVCLHFREQYLTYV